MLLNPFPLKTLKTQANKMCCHFFGNIFNLKLGIFIFPNKCIYHVSYHGMKEISLRNILPAKIGQNRGDWFGFISSSEYFVVTYLKEQYFSNKLHFKLKLIRDFQREERTEMQLAEWLSSRHPSIHHRIRSAVPKFFY